MRATLDHLPVAKLNYYVNKNEFTGSGLEVINILFESNGTTKVNI